MGFQGGRWGIRPPVQVQENVDIESNWWLPVLKCWVGVTISFFMSLAALGFLFWLIPPDIAFDIAAWCFAAIASALFGIGAIRFILLYPNTIHFFLATLVLAVMAWQVSSLPDTWWSEDDGIWIWIQFAGLISVVAGGASGCYWFIKELRPYELTGREKFQKEMAEKELDWEKVKADRQWEFDKAAMEPNKVWQIEIAYVNGNGEPEQGKQVRYLEFNGISEDKFAVFAANCLAGQEPTYSYFAGKGKQFSRPQFDQITDKLKARGFLVPKGTAPNAPLQFNHGGLAFLRAWLDEYDMQKGM